MPAARLVTSEMPSTSSPRLPRGDGLQRGRHADQIPAQHARPSAPRPASRTAARGTGRTPPRATAGSPLDEFTEPLRVRLGQVDERRADQRGRAGEIDVVADQHRGSRGPVRIEAAAAVRQHDDLGAGGGRGADAVHDLLHPEALVVVGASGEDRADLARAGPDDPQRTAVTDHRRLGEAGQLGQLAAADQLAKIIGGGRPARTQHEGRVETGDAETLAERVRGPARQRVRIGRDGTQQQSDISAL